MCGIFAYTGGRNAKPILLEGLSTLEYRGYDSAGLYLSDQGVTRTPGAVTELKAKATGESEAKSGLAHLRWATHGEPTEANAHPHADCDGEVYIAHNGIIENFKELKEGLVARGHSFK
ncbi:MAG: glutamine--fructose-6-phosphate aminotransferase, partial [Patescibacteria group bacterium]